MTEEQALAWVRERFPADAVDRLQRLAALVVTANAEQNLIAPSTVDHIWARHIVDSLQLLEFAQPGTWLDIGSGAGFPGLVIAAAESGRKMVLAEPRKLRVDHLIRSAEAIGATNVTVAPVRAGALAIRAAVISARAVAPTIKLFTEAHRCADLETIWILPKGRGAEVELADARKSWQGTFHVEQSITSPDSRILVAQGVRPR